MNNPQSVSELKRQSIEDDNKKVLFTNIDNEDFTWNFAGKPTTIKASKTEELPLKIAILFRKHLVDKIKGKDKFKDVEKNRLLELIIKWKP